MGLIDADELREYMERHCEFCKRCLRIYEYLQGRCELCPMSQVYALIDPEAGLKTQTRKWIPCSERLPEENGWYIGSKVTPKGNHMTNAFWYESGTFFTLGEVIAWMPLPEPYKRGETE